MRSDYHEPLNLGQDRLVTINQLADMIADIAGTRIVKKHIRGPQGVRGRNSDNTRLRQVLGWEPEISLEDGLARTYAWIEGQVCVSWIRWRESEGRELSDTPISKTTHPGPRILFLKQTVYRRFWFVELGADLADMVGPSLMYADVDTKMRVRYLQILPAPTYRRDSDLHRLWSWFRYFVGTARVIWETQSGSLLFIVAQPPYLPVLGYLRNVLYKQKYVVWMDDIYPDVLIRHKRLPERSIIARVWKWFNCLILSRAEKVFTLGPCMAETLRQYLHHNSGSDQLMVVPTWVDSQAIHPLPKGENPFAIQHGQVGKLTVLYSGNLGLSHDLGTMVEAARHLRDNSNICFMIIGAGPRWGEVEKAGDELPNLTVLPYQPEEVLPFSLTTGDVAVVSLDQGFEGLSMPSKTYYMMAAGAALLGLSAEPSDLQWVIEQHRCGVNVQPGDTEGFVRAVSRFCEDESFLHACRQNARYAAEHMFSRKVNVQRVLQAVRPLLSGTVKT
jgi:glycosyltransferase involved in cell wall biosynthesis